MKSVYSSDLSFRKGSSSTRQQHQPKRRRKSHPSSVGHSTGGPDNPHRLTKPQYRRILRNGSPTSSNLTRKQQRQGKRDEEKSVLYSTGRSDRSYRLTKPCHGPTILNGPPARSDNRYDFDEEDESSVDEQSSEEEDESSDDDEASEEESESSDDDEASEDESESSDNDESSEDESGSSDNDASSEDESGSSDDEESSEEEIESSDNEESSEDESESSDDEELARRLKNIKNFLDAATTRNGKKQSRRDAFAGQKKRQRRSKENRQQRKVRLQEEQNKMMSTRTGRSLKFVEAMLAKIQEMQVSRYVRRVSGFEVVTEDDMVFMARRLLRFQSMLAKTFKGRRSQKRVESWLHVDIGYHYTTEKALETIQTDGLLSKNERIKSNVGKQTGGEMFGNGVYTSNDPKVFDVYGPVGLMVARLKGFSSPRLDMTCDLSKVEPPEKSIYTPPVYNTIIGNKKSKMKNHADRETRRHDEVVLKTCAQVIPLVKFDKGADAQRLRSVQGILQKLLDDFFNDN